MPTDLPRHRADRSGRCGDHEGLFGLWRADLRETEISRESGDAVYAQQVRDRFQGRQFVELLCGPDGILLPAAVAEDEIALFEFGIPRFYDLAKDIACHDVTRLDGWSVGRSLHPGPVGSVDRDVPDPDQDLALAGFRYVPFLEHEMLMVQFPLRDLGQHELSVLATAHR
jgi:hypothetical protein